MGSENAFQKIFHAHRFVLKLVWQIDKKRILLEFAECFCAVYSYLVYGAFFTQIILALAEKKTPFDSMMALLWTAFIPLMLTHIFTQYDTYVAGPVSDVRFYEGMNRLLYQKACQVDMTCYEDSEFYNQYMMAVREAKTRVPKLLHNFCDMTVSFFLALVGFYMIFRIDRYALLFIIFPILGNFVFNGILSGRVFQREKETILFTRIADYVNRTIHLADYAKEIRLSNVFSLLRQQYEQSVKSTQKVVDRYAVKNMFYFFCFQYFLPL